MARWEPDSEDRFRVAALELFGEIGFEHTTVAAIARRAGLTSRTFFRYFTDKREVLFNGSQQLQKMMVDALLDAPPEATSLDAVAAALTKPAIFFNAERRPFARLRNTVIAANPELHERELTKMATLSAALAEALRQRGVESADASLLAEMGIAVFRLAFGQWVSESECRNFDEIVSDAITRLRVLSRL